MAEPINNGKNELRIVHFNDVYKVRDQELVINGQKETIDVTKFATLLNSVRQNWQSSGYDPAQGLTIFSGDAFAPSPESTITRGKHMAEVLNALKVEVGVAGNHEFDHGIPQMSSLMKDISRFPWLLSNINTETGAVPGPMEEFVVLEKSGVRIGIIGLVEREWTTMIKGWPLGFKWQDMVEVGDKLSRKLRDPAGPHKCDLVIALTHSLFPDDIKIAKALYALSPEAQAKPEVDIASRHGVDLLLGGHDHVYWISKGLSGSWEGYDNDKPIPNTESDGGDTLIVKSGTDFRELSEITLTLKDTAPGSVRRKVIGSITGKRHVTTGNLASDPIVEGVIMGVRDKVKIAQTKVVCVSEIELDARKRVIRNGESVLGNWITDCLKPAYDEVLTKLELAPVDGVIQCMGSIQANRVFPEGNITQGDLGDIFPYDDPMVVVEMTGDALWTAMNHGLSGPGRGRFPAISGFRVEWNSLSKPPVQGMWLRRNSKEAGPDGKPKVVEEEIQNTTERTYIISIPEFMFTGGDGYKVFEKQKLIIPAESGLPKVDLICQFLRGARYLANALNDPNATHLLPETSGFLSQARELSQSNLTSQTSVQSDAAQGFAHKMAVSDDVDFDISAMDNPVVDFGKLVQQITTPSEWIALALKVAAFEDTSLVDPYEEVERQQMNVNATGLFFKRAVDEQAKAVEVFPTIHPALDGRLKDLAEGASKLD
ncbi:Metallo-dependent phosphatase [Pluteus cervinus]|uniref:Metallo-dependent phosphatase n=1 Tax=Pluteus cervinus TaxID=181527 RepID=A0ACD3B7V0_9AGAR|nr:Metallo-dependent phosphatase [Pluteus cervinus]